ncbi:hypothetical protein GOBAR_DD11055 [Gossypium barbadense]|nr:hypothetical protein GOBAR_DD11055 [Gossypium barbadense]
MEKTKLFQAPTELEAPFVSKRGGQVIHISFDEDHNMSGLTDLDSYISTHVISSSIPRKPYALEEVCTIWEGVLIDRSKRRIYFNRYAFRHDQHNIEITLGRRGQLARAPGKTTILKLHSGEVRLISKNCSATVGHKSLGRSGSKCWLGKRSRKRNKYSDNLILRRWSKYEILFISSSLQKKTIFLK